MSEEVTHGNKLLAETQEGQRHLEELKADIMKFKPLNILIVDDEPSIRDSFKMILAMVNQNLETAPDAETGLKLLEKKTFDLVFHDLRPPGMDGIEALKIIKQKYPKVEVVIHAVFASEKAHNQAIELGAMDYIRCPFTMEQIYELVLRVIKTKVKL